MHIVLLQVLYKRETSYSAKSLCTVAGRTYCKQNSPKWLNGSVLTEIKWQSSYNPLALTLLNYSTSTTQQQYEGGECKML